MKERETTVLGLDIGANSVGWALLRASEGPDGELRPLGLRALGVRIFPENCDGDRDTGQDRPRNQARREARRRRRMLEHRSRRLSLVFGLLQAQGLLPAFPGPGQEIPGQSLEQGSHSCQDTRSRTGENPDTGRTPREAGGAGARRPDGPARHRLLLELDAALWLRQAPSPPGPAGPVNRHLRPALLPCLLRAQALSRPLSPHELGRALFHLARRRGEQAPEGFPEARLRDPATPGALLAGLALAGRPLRGTPFPRESLRREFEAIWAAQAPHHPALLTEAFRLRLARAIFHQRPWKSPVGRSGPGSFREGLRLHPPARPRDRLPPLFLALELPPNPVVARALAEMRKVVNALVREHGKPGLIRVETARDLDLGRTARRAIWERGQRQDRERARARDDAARTVLAFRGCAAPTEEEVAAVPRAWTDRLLLARECGFTCPYTGQTLDPGDLFGPERRVDLEHIIPLSRGGGRSLANTTLCLAVENRGRKGRRTPHEAYGQDPERYAAILRRVEGFAPDPALAAAKLRRFRDQGNGAEISTPRGRRLSDTAQACARAVDYLRLLYGAGGKGRVLGVSARTVARVRGVLRLSGLLGPGGKDRRDHRHHAVDALACALASAGDGPAPGAPEPWPGFREETRLALAACLPSHRVRRKARGALHAETLYRLASGPDGTPRVMLREPLSALTPREILSEEAIADPVVRARVRQAWEGSGRKAPALLFAGPEHRPARPGDAEHTLRRVRLPQALRVTPIGTAPHERIVHPALNHHLAVFERAPGGSDKATATDASATAEASSASGASDPFGAPGGRRAWVGRVVTLLEAMDRKRRGLPIVDRRAGPGERFLFSLAKSEVLEVRLDGVTEYLRLRTFYPDPAGGARLELVRLADARRQKDVGRKSRDNGWFKFSLKQLGKLPCRKVRITPLGQVAPAND